MEIPVEPEAPKVPAWRTWLKESKYFQPSSVAWWASVIPIIAGVIKALGTVHPSLGGMVAVIDAFTGEPLSPGILINLGLVGIGLRGAIGNDKK
jgi:hypothetical protein